MARNKVIKKITPDRFAKFLAWLDPHAEKAGEEYERLRFRLMTFFSHRNCRYPDELADETINRVVLKLEEEVIEKKNAYFYGVARNVFLESLRREKVFLNVDNLQVRAAEDKKEDEEDSAYRTCLEKCLDKLPPARRKLILDYFSQSRRAKIDLRKKMSDTLNISKTALRMKVMRIKKKLRMCIEKCLA